jgi:hypothetical protein
MEELGWVLEAAGNSQNGAALGAHGPAYQLLSPGSIGWVPDFF